MHIHSMGVIKQKKRSVDIIEAPIVQYRALLIAWEIPRAQKQNLPGAQRCPQSSTDLCAGRGGNKIGEDNLEPSHIIQYIALCRTRGHLKGTKNQSKSHGGTTQRNLKSSAGPKPTHITHGGPSVHSRALTISMIVSTATCSRGLRSQAASEHPTAQQQSVHSIETPAGQISLSPHCTGNTYGARHRQVCA